MWLGENRKCSAAVEGLALLLGLSMVRRCSLNRSFKRRLVSPKVLQITTVTFNHADEVLVSQVRLDLDNSSR